MTLHTFPKIQIFYSVLSTPPNHPSYQASSFSAGPTLFNGTPRSQMLIQMPPAEPTSITIEFLCFATLSTLELNNEPPLYAINTMLICP